MTPPKKMLKYTKNVFPTFSENVAFFENIVTWKNIRNLISYKKGLFIFVLRRPFPKRGTGPPETIFRHFLKKCSFFWKNLNNKIFRTKFETKKVILIFGARRSLFLKKMVK